MLMKIVCYYVVVINMASFFAYGVDKRKAKKNKWRIPERILILLAAVGGSIGALLGMSVFHHKTQKIKFKIGVPVILGMQITIIVLLLLKIKGFV